MNAIRTWVGSVRGRITLIVAAVFAVALTLGGTFLLQRAQAAWVDDIRAQDRVELQQLAARIQEMGPYGLTAILPVGVDGTVFRIVDADGDLVASTPPTAILRGPDGPSDVSFSDTATAVAASDPSTVVSSVSVASTNLDRVVTLTATSSLQPVLAGVDALRGLLRFAIPLLVLVVGGMTWLVTGRSFRPVAAITNQVDRITGSRLDERVPVPNSRDEVAHLATTMNGMLDRLATSRQQQRQFISDASHELRSPVAASRATLEVALASPEATDWRATATTVLEEQQRLADLIDDLLLLTRIDEDGPTSFEQVDLDDIVLAETSRPRRVPIDASMIGAARVHGDHRHLVRLVRNLIDNATRHATSDVAVWLTTEGDDIVLAVDDDGPGIPEPDRLRIFERFVRLSDARSRNDGGSGIGLALVRAVATAHGGTVTVGDADLGGARFEVCLPRSHEGVPDRHT